MTNIPGTNQPMPGYQHGTGGRFLDFGTGTRVMLHGLERVQTQWEGKAQLEGLQALDDRLASIELLLKDQPRLLRDLTLQQWRS